MTEERSF